MTDYIKREFLHYVFVFVLLSISWVLIMNVFNNLAITWLFNFALFIIYDKIAHKIFKLK